MEILGIEKVSLVDYQNKICATIFTGGCNFLCPFCHNAQIVKKEFKKYDEEEILSYLKDRKKILDAVTISGGEPTLQPDLDIFIEKVKAMGYLIKLDTNGTFPNVIEKLAKKKLLDYVAIDIKNAFDEYPPICGVPNINTENIKNSLKILKDFNLPYELRTTLVKGFHTKETISKMAKDLEGEKLLYLQKFVDSGACMKENLEAIKKEEAFSFKEILSSTIENVELRGY